MAGDYNFGGAFEALIGLCILLAYLVITTLICFGGPAFGWWDLEWWQPVTGLMASWILTHITLKKVIKS